MYGSRLVPRVVIFFLEKTKNFLVKTKNYLVKTKILRLIFRFHEKKITTRGVTLQFVIITQFVINYKLRWIATQFVIHYKLRSEF